MKNLCIIPARGGSKRIPKKNIKSFLGKPIIAYSIEAAIKSNLFDEVMVSTDDNEIAAVAKQYGAKVPFMRSPENSNDFATTFDVIEEVLKHYTSKNIIFKNACCIYACAPFVTSKKIKSSFDILINNNNDTVFPILAYSTPIQRALKLNSNNKIEMFNSKHLTTRSQDLELSYYDAGQFYWMNIKQILAERKLLTKNTEPIIISELEGQDIDNEIDWKLAELKFKVLHDICK